jgi:hypothetical protein
LITARSPVDGILISRLHPACLPCSRLE